MSNAKIFVLFFLRQFGIRKPQGVALPQGNVETGLRRGEKQPRDCKHFVPKNRARKIFRFLGMKAVIS